MKFKILATATLLKMLAADGGRSAWLCAQKRRILDGRLPSSVGPPPVIDGILLTLIVQVVRLS